MTRIESHLGLDLLITPNEPDLDLMQDDAPVSHVPLNIHPSAKSSLPQNRVVIESKLDQLTGHIKQFISSIGGASLEQADSASSV
ncbi:hypothetical protein RhiirA1_476986 [Rhizophagus irregularis]|uniref:Uncharacterized protein n=1 Tax=Rhizophagus irregularis TaxID=588596 RepID=A0A2N0QU55_9GLOM|nr:hypothetical protein RhiirA1_476986 [Rhizophagus irregularis]